MASTSACPASVAATCSEAEDLSGSFSPEAVAAVSVAAVAGSLPSTSFLIVSVRLVKQKSYLYRG